MWIALGLSFKTNPLEGILPPVLSHIIVAAITFLAMELTTGLARRKGCGGSCNGDKGSK